MTYYNYLWIREPHLKTELHLDNHDVHISAFDFVAIKEDRQFPGLGVKVKLKRHLGKIRVRSVVQADGHKLKTLKVLECNSNNNEINLCKDFTGKKFCSPLSNIKLLFQSKNKPHFLQVII